MSIDGPTHVGVRARSARPAGAVLMALLAGAGLVAAGCTSGASSDAGASEDRTPGRAAFLSSAPLTQGEGPTIAGGRAITTPEASNAGGDPGGGQAGSSSSRVEDTDIYRVEGDRLYFLNGHRGLLVFDITAVDQPRLVGRSEILGTPVGMIVRDGIAILAVADWYGQTDDARPFHGSVVRAVDARDPVNIRVLGDARIAGSVRDTRAVGDVLYTVSEDVGQGSYGWSAGEVAGSGGVGSATNSGANVVVFSVSFAGGVVQQTGRFELPGAGGNFSIGQGAILFAHDVQPSGVAAPGAAKLALDYVDISDPGGAITRRSSLLIEGRLLSSGSDNGRWNLDFADGKTANVLAQVDQALEGGQSVTGYVLATADFSDASAPVLVSTLPITTGTAWSPTARFEGPRMYLAPADAFSFFEHNDNKTPIQVYDLTDPRAPIFAGQTSIDGAVWSFTPAGNRLFILGNVPNNVTTHGAYDGSTISVNYVDVTDPSNPTVLAGAAFADEWASTPGAGAFKAFTRSDEQQLVVLPYSAWDARAGHYNNGLQLLELTPTAVAKAGAARTTGWVERGVFAKGRLWSLSDLSLAVIDTTDRQAPRVTSELTLARNVVDARPNGDTIAELSSDWWYGQDVDHSELRFLSTALVGENVSGAASAEVPIEGTHPRAFQNGAFSYVVSRVRHEVTCPAPASPEGSTSSTTDVERCFESTDQVQVVEYVGGQAVARGRKALPPLPNPSNSDAAPGFAGCYPHDWYYGDDVVQVGRDVLAFRRWTPVAGSGETGAYLDAQSSLIVVDLADPDAPAVASAVITADRGWWGNMRTLGDTLYVAHYESKEPPEQRTAPARRTVQYFLDRVDLRDRAHPVVAAKISVPGLVVGSAETEPSRVYTIDYRWYGDHGGNELDVLRLRGDVAELEATRAIPGYVGSTFVRGDKAYASVAEYVDGQYQQAAVRLWQLDLSNPQNIGVGRSAPSEGWGWLLGVEGNRVLVTSGWGGSGVDVYRMSEGAPIFDRFVRTVGFGPSSLARQGNRIFLATGRWGVATIDVP